ncbi:MAG TPA: hypothetical protein PK156_50545 [Polyangium sp.]|nr:hypothetical protein [Polyangium sp.]
MRFIRLVPIAYVALSLCVALPANAQTDEEKAAARALATQGAAALQENKFAEALDLVTRAEAILHAPPHLLMIGRAQVGLGRLVAAQETFLKATREQLAATAPPAFKKAQLDARAELDLIEPKIGSLRIALTGAGAADAGKVTVKMDEQAVPSALIGVHRPVDPGKHTITAFVTGRNPVTQEVTLGDGEKKEIELSVEPPISSVDEDKKPITTPAVTPPPAKMSPLRIAGIAGMGLGVAGLVVGGVFLGLKSSVEGEANADFTKCNPQPGGCTDTQKKRISDLDNDAAKKGTIGVAGLVAGGVFVGAGVALFIIGGKKAEPKPATSYVLPYVTPNGGGFVGTF